MVHFPSENPHREAEKPVVEDWRPADEAEARRLRSVLYRLLERHDASPEVLSIVGSLFDTLPVSDCIDVAEDWLSSGDVLRSAQ